jgi:hypothetical protein
MARTVSSKSALKAAAKTTGPNSWLQNATVRATRIHFLYIAAYILNIIMFDSWNLIPHDAVAQRWTAAGLLLGVNTVLWYVARMKFNGTRLYTTMLWVLITADIAFAGYNVFWQRGMASKAVMLFAIPIITAAMTRSRSAVLATATLCTAVYTTAAVRYFNLHYGEGFRVELYGEILFYSAVFFVIVWLLFVLIRPGSDA